MTSLLLTDVVANLVQNLLSRCDDLVGVFEHHAKGEVLRVNRSECFVEESMGWVSGSEGSSHWRQRRRGSKVIVEFSGCSQRDERVHHGFSNPTCGALPSVLTKLLLEAPGELVPRVLIGGTIRYPERVPHDKFPLALTIRR